jgi:hypothetical protein
MSASDRLIFGIRHHGPGSARSVVAALDETAPDCVLVEGPPDADALIPLVADPAMQPPVAILVYRPDEPARAVYYPFAEFSPEWQALVWARGHGVPARFMDLPQANRMATRFPRERGEIDPLEELGRAAGYDDGERWWEQLVEERRDPAGLFAGILEAMTTVRASAPPATGEEAAREASMRRILRESLRSHGRVAVVCGAWHAPALAELPPASADSAILRGLPRVKVAATFVPWSHGRLALASGYGAGIRSPGWYEHLWRDGSTAGWMVRTARLLRAEDLDASSGHVIDAVRLAETLAALRGRPVASLGELTEATQAVLCFGSELPMRLVDERLIVGETLGQVPEHTPIVPLARDLAAEQRRLRLRPDPFPRALELDLRKPTDLDRSHLLHRLQLLEVPWGEPQEAAEGRMGTFRESWRLAWDPELAVRVIEASLWGTSVGTAAAARAADLAVRTPDLPGLSALLDVALLADLPDTAAAIMARLDAVAAVAADVLHLMRALPPLANVVRYGSVRQTHSSVVAHVIAGMVARICVGLPAACASLDDTAAQQMLDEIMAVDAALHVAGSDAQRGAWLEALATVADDETVHGLVAGRATRLLFDAGTLERPEVTRRAAIALAPVRAPESAGAWAEGFLRQSGLLLLHDDGLWEVVDRWLDGLTPEAFTQALPLLRRTFASFPVAERRQIGERARRGAAAPVPSVSDFDEARAAAVLPQVRRLLGAP